MENTDWYCAQCLRMIRQGIVTYKALPDQYPRTMHGHLIPEVLKTYGARSLSAYSNERIPLFAFTMINGEYRCYNHLEKA